MNVVNFTSKSLFLTFIAVAILAMLILVFFGTEDSSINFVGGVSFLVALASVMLAVRIRLCK